MSDPVLLVAGGTGAVGEKVAESLTARGHRVTVGARHLDRARVVSDRLPATASVEVDLLGEPLQATPRSILVNCTGLESIETVERWRTAGWAWVDITASSDYAAELAGLGVEGPAVVVGVGLMPGLTSVLATDLVRAEPATRALTISCVLGLGEDHGAASGDWTYGQLGRTVTDSTGDFRNFSAPAAVLFPGGFGRRRAWRFDFADRVLLPPVLGVDVTTRYCFDSRLAGRALAIAAAVPHGPSAMRRLGESSAGAIGATAWWAGVVESDTGARRTAIGCGQSRGTALMTALVIEALIEHDSGAGVRLGSDLLDVGTLTTELATMGVLVQ